MEKIVTASLISQNYTSRSGTREEEEEKKKILIIMWFGAVQVSYYCAVDALSVVYCTAVGFECYFESNFVHSCLR